MVIKFKFDSSIDSVLIDGYRALTQTSQGAEGNSIFSIGKDTAWNSFNDTTGTFTTSNLAVGSLNGLLKAVDGAVSAAIGGTDYEPAQTKGSISETASSVLTVSNGSSSTVGPNVTIQVKKASASQDGYFGKDDFANFVSGSAITKYDLSETASGVLTIVGGTDSILTNDVTIQVKKSSASQDGYLGKDDWTTFNAKQNALSFSDLLSGTASAISITNGTDVVVGSSDVTITINKASASVDGYLGKDDWTTFNAKQNALSFSDVLSGTASVLSITNGTDVIVGSSDVTLTIGKASASADGYLGKDDWATFNAKLTSPLTVNGDTLYYNSGHQKLGIGSSGQVLTVINSLPSWQDTAVGSQILNDNTRAYVKDTGSDGYFAIETEGLERFRVGPEGKVGVATDAPTSMLDVVGDVEVGSTNWYYVGDPTTNGSWRTGLDSGEFVIQKRVTGTWETKGAFS